MSEARAIPGDNQTACHDAGAIGPLELLVLQATPFCNLDCSYCYLPNRDDPDRMDLSVIEQAIRQVLDAGLVENEFSVIWHAGEPLVLGTDFYESAFELISGIMPSRYSVHHSFQTNAVLIDDAWCEFFNRHRVRLGLSIDGPAAIHDRFRKTRNGKGTHARVTRAVNRLIENGVNFHVIAVLTDESIQQPDELFDYFHGLGIEYLCFNIEEIEGCNQASALLENDRYSDYVAFLERFQQLRRRHDSKLKIREIDGAVSSVMQWKKDAASRHLRPQENSPFKILNVDVKGNYCTFSPELLGVDSKRYGAFELGNLFSGSLLDCLHQPRYQRVARAIRAGVENCRDQCAYFELCGGGSPSNKLAENGRLDSTETGFCRLQKKACLDVAIKLLEEELGIVA